MRPRRVAVAARSMCRGTRRAGKAGPVRAIVSAHLAPARRWWPTGRQKACAGQHQPALALCRIRALKHAAQRGQTGGERQGKGHRGGRQVTVQSCGECGEKRDGGNENGCVCAAVMNRPTGFHPDVRTGTQKQPGLEQAVGQNMPKGGGVGAQPATEDHEAHLRDGGSRQRPLDIRPHRHDANAIERRHEAERRGSGPCQRGRFQHRGKADQQEAAGIDQPGMHQRGDWGGRGHRAKQPARKGRQRAARGGRDHQQQRGQHRERHRHGRRCGQRGADLQRTGMPRQDRQRPHQCSIANREGRSRAPHRLAGISKLPGMADQAGKSHAAGDPRQSEEREVAGCDKDEDTAHQCIDRPEISALA